MAKDLLIFVDNNTLFMETSIFEDAIKAYAKYNERYGYIFSQPNEQLSMVGRKYVHLENINGKLAKYEIATKKIITNDRKQA